MTFTFTQETVLRCTECAWCSTAKHFRDDKTCTLCRGAAEPVETIERDDGVTDFAYRMMLDDLEESASGVGRGTIESIEERFDPDGFVDACEAGYTRSEYDALLDVSGVGQSTAESICETIGANRDWEQSQFSLSG